MNEFNEQHIKNYIFPITDDSTEHCISSYFDYLPIKDHDRLTQCRRNNALVTGAKFFNDFGKPCRNTPF